MFPVRNLPKLSEIEFAATRKYFLTCRTSGRRCSFSRRMVPFWEGDPRRLETTVPGRAIVIEFVTMSRERKKLRKRSAAEVLRALTAALSGLDKTRLCNFRARVSERFHK